MIKDLIIQNWHLQVFNSQLYNSDSYIDYKLFNTNVNDWEALIKQLNKDYKLALFNFNEGVLSGDFQISKILEQERRNEFFLELHLKNMTSRIYINSNEIIEGDIHRSKIKNYENFLEFINFIENVCRLLGKNIHIYNEMDEEEAIFIIEPAC